METRANGMFLIWNNYIKDNFSNINSYERDFLHLGQSN